MTKHRGAPICDKGDPLELVGQTSRQLEVVLLTTGGRLIVVGVRRDHAGTERLGDRSIQTNLDIQDVVIPVSHLGSDVCGLPEAGATLKLVLKAFAEAQAKVATRPF